MGTLIQADETLIGNTVARHFKKSWWQSDTHDRLVRRAIAPAAVVAVAGPDRTPAGQRSGGGASPPGRMLQSVAAVRKVAGLRFEFRKRMYA